jgi:signal peptidase I
MLPTINDGDRVLISLSSYQQKPPRRGDIIVYSRPKPHLKHELKRVIGLPGERIDLEGGVLTVDGKWVKEPYLGNLPSTIGLDPIRWTLTEEEYVVLGDNRAQSTDSRKYGPVKYDQIIGHLRFRYWPLGQWHLVGK